MKLLENTKLDVITSALCMDTGDCKIMGRYVYVLMWLLRNDELPNNLLGLVGRRQCRLVGRRQCVIDYYVWVAQLKISDNAVWWLL